MPHGQFRAKILSLAVALYLLAVLFFFAVLPFLFGLSRDQGSASAPSRSLPLFGTPTYAAGRSPCSLMCTRTCARTTRLRCYTLALFCISAAQVWVLLWRSDDIATGHAISAGLAQVSEFGFVLAVRGVRYGFLTQPVYFLLISVVRQLRLSRRRRSAHVLCCAARARAQTSPRSYTHYWRECVCACVCGATRHALVSQTILSRHVLLSVAGWPEPADFPSHLQNLFQADEVLSTVQRLAKTKRE